MTVLVAAPERTASRVADVLSDRSVSVTHTVANARERLADEPTVVLVATHLPDETGTDLLAAVRSGEHCDPETPVLELVAADDADEPASTDDDADLTIDAAGTDAGSTFDDRVSLADPGALGKAMRLAIAVSEYREATARLYDRSRRRSADDSIDPDELDEARRAANDRLTTVQRAADGRTPFRRLLSE